MAPIPDRSNFDDEQTRIFEQILEDDNRSWWIKGYAGTGKTILLIHLANEYLKARKKVAYVTYTHALVKRARDDLESLGVRQDKLPIFTVDAFNSSKKSYDLILVDEVQDLPQNKIEKLLSSGGRFIFAGDLNQSIFLSSAKPDRIKKLLGNPKVVELRDIYRLPEAISYASHLVYEEADSAENALVTVHEDSSVNIVKARSEEAEVSWVYEQALKEARPGMPSAILFSDHKDLQNFISTLASIKGLGTPPAVGKLEVSGGRDYGPVNRFLKKHGLSLAMVGGAGGGEINTANRARMVFAMILHSAKGLGFQSIFMPYMHSDRLPCPYKPLKNKDEWQRRFVYVALTRTQLNFYASYTGEMNDILIRLEDESLGKYLNYIKA